MNDSTESAPSLSARAEVMVRGAILQGRYEGYGIEVARTDHGWAVTQGACTLYAWDAEDLRETITRLLTQRADRSQDEAPERVRVPVSTLTVGAL